MRTLFVHGLEPVLDVKKGMAFLGKWGALTLHLRPFHKADIMREGGQALTQLATHSVKLSVKAVVKARKIKCSPSADTPCAAYSGISQKLKACNEASGAPPSPTQRDPQAT